MAFMKSNNTGKFYLTNEFSEWSDMPQEEASRVRSALGFGTEEVSPETINQERTRSRVNRALLVKEIADAILPAIASGLTVTAEVDERAIALAVEAQLADEFDAIPTAEQNGQAARDAIVK